MRTGAEKFKRLLAELKARGVPRAQVARELDTSEWSLSMWANDKIVPDTFSQCRIIRYAVNVGYDEVFSLRDWLTPEQQAKLETLEESWASEHG